MPKSDRARKVVAFRARAARDDSPTAPRRPVSRCRSTAPRRPAVGRRRAARRSRLASWCERAAYGARRYERGRDLPGLIALWPAEVADPGEAATRRIIALLEKAQREERRRGVAGHWSYDLSRHMALTAALKAERSRLRRFGSPSSRASSF